MIERRRVIPTEERREGGCIEGSNIEGSKMRRQQRRVGDEEGIGERGEEEERVVGAVAAAVGAGEGGDGGEGVVGVVAGVEAGWGGDRGEREVAEGVVRERQRQQGGEVQRQRGREL